MWISQYDDRRNVPYKDKVKENTMYVENINFTPTMRCNLKCKLCGVMVPHYEYRPHMNEDEWKKTLKALFEIVDKVRRFQVTGGEPLVHPYLDQVLREIFEYDDQFEELWLFTNCAVPLRANVLEVLKTHKDKVLVHCSDYGVRPEVAQANIRLMEENDIPHRYLKYYGENQYFDGWVDNGDFVAHNRSEEENTKIFKECSHTCRGGSWYVRGGQIHWCGRSIRGTELGKIPSTKLDYLDLFDENTTIEQKKQMFEELQKRSVITACDYCNGYYGTTDVSKRYPAGEQME
mgnify:FL=1